MNVTLILAKEGSLGLPGKNIWKIKNRTLLEWTVDDARNSKLVDEVFVSTNGEETAEIARRAGAQVIMRADELAKNELFMEAVNHAVRFIKERHPDLDVIALPECVVPFRDPDIFDRSIGFLKAHPEYDSAVTIRKLSCIPEAIMKIENGALSPYFPEAQKHVPIYRQGSAGFEIDHTLECFRYGAWLKQDTGIRPWAYLGRKIKGMEQTFHNPNCFVDIHAPEDIEWLEFMVEQLGFQGMARTHGGVKPQRSVL
jgi:CMP-N-acetylneuraminic acid synthetase